MKKTNHNVNRMWRMIHILGLVGLCFSLSAVGETNAPAGDPPVPAVKGKDDVESAYDQMQILTEIMLHIRRQYVKEKTYEEIMRGALHGMLSALDSHSDFLEPEAYDDVKDDTTGKFGGIGIQIGLRDGVLTVIAPIEDTPGFRAGLQAGDLILKIDGEKTQGLTLREAMKKLRGPKGAKVVLTIRSQNEDEPRDVEIIRDDIPVASIKGARLLKDGVGYIRITQFMAPTAGDLQVELDKLLASGMNALVLDLRNNPGGLLRSAIEVSQIFLKRKALVVTTRGREGAGDEIRSMALGKRHHVDFPLAILVNRGSASASEIVAGCLQDHNRAVLIGETTFGKGSVQSVIRLGAEQEAAIRLTSAYYFTPSGRQIHEKGIEPDIPVYVSLAEWRNIQIGRAQIENPGVFTEEEKKRYTDVVDKPLERAVDLLQALKIFQARK